MSLFGCRSRPSGAGEMASCDGIMDTLEEADSCRCCCDGTAPTTATRTTIGTNTLPGIRRHLYLVLICLMASRTGSRQRTTEGYVGCPRVRCPRVRCEVPRSGEVPE